MPEDLNTLDSHSHSAETSDEARKRVLESIAEQRIQKGDRVAFKRKGKVSVFSGSFLSVTDTELQIMTKREGTARINFSDLEYIKKSV